MFLPLSVTSSLLSLRSNISYLNLSSDEEVIQSLVVINQHLVKEIKSILLDEKYEEFAFTKIFSRGSMDSFFCLSTVKHQYNNQINVC